MRSHAQTLRSMSKHIPDKKALSSIVQYLDDVGATVDGRALMSERDRDAKDISQALLATHLKSVKDLSHIAKGALQAQFPGSAGASTSRSAHFLSSTQFRIDMAYMLLTRDIGFKNCLLKWAWADSSPQGGHDFMLWKYKYIFAQMLLPVAAALVLLVTTMGGALGGEVGEDMEISFSTEAARTAAVLVLLKNVLEHLCVLI